MSTSRASSSKPSIDASSPDELSPFIPHQPPTRSLFLDLPVETRNRIAFYALTSNTSIVNPAPSKVSVGHAINKPVRRTTPALGTSLLRTSRKIYLETDIRPLYTHNTFTFTRLAHIHAFVSSLAPQAIKHLKSLTISLCETSMFPSSADGTPTHTVAIEWLHYLTCTSQIDARPSGVWCSRLSTLRTDVPYLQHLTLDLKGLRRYQVDHFAAMGAKRGSGVAIAHFLGKIRGLESLELTGTGADLWDLVGLSRPCLVGEWWVFERWMEAVDDVVVPVLQAAIEGECWTGFWWDGRQAAFGALSSGEVETRLAGDASFSFCSWDDCLEKTRVKCRIDHPLIKFLDNVRIPCRWGFSDATEALWKLRG